MRYRSAVCVLYACALALPAWAQAPGQEPASAPDLMPPPAWAFNDLACGPALALEGRAEPDTPRQRVVGSQDTTVRDLFGPGDTLVVSGGSNAGLQAGERYFVRRLVTTRGGLKPLPPTIHTAGWVQILGVDTMLATATVLYACDGILLDDYLEPFAPPTIAASVIPGTTPQFENMGHIMTGGEGLHTAGGGQLMTIDRGGNAGVVAGQRFLVFRDKREQRVETTGRSNAMQRMDGLMPLVEIGQVLVVSVRADDATVQVLAAKEPITTGDLIAPLR